MRGSPPWPVSGRAPFGRDLAFDVGFSVEVVFCALLTENPTSTENPTGSWCRVVTSWMRWVIRMRLLWHPPLPNPSLPALRSGQRSNAVVPGAGPTTAPGRRCYWRWRLSGNRIPYGQRATRSRTWVGFGLVMRRWLRVPASARDQRQPASLAGDVHAGPAGQRTHDYYGEPIRRRDQRRLPLRREARPITERCAGRFRAAHRRGWRPDDNRSPCPPRVMTWGKPQAVRSGER